MKQIVKTTLAVIALATLTSEIAVAQQQVAKNRRERILQVLDQSRPNAYVPAGFFLHFENKLGRKAVQDHKDFYRATNMDFVKVFYEISVPQIDIKSGKDWEKVPVYSEAFFAPQVAVIEDLAREFGKEAFILPTVYSPLALAHQTLRRIPRLSVRPSRTSHSLSRTTCAQPASMVPTASMYRVRAATATRFHPKSGRNKYASGTSTFLRLPTRLAKSTSCTSATTAHRSRMPMHSMPLPTILPVSSTCP